MKIIGKRLTIEVRHKVSEFTGQRTIEVEAYTKDGEQGGGTYIIKGNTRFSVKLKGGGFETFDREPTAILYAAQQVL